MLTRRFVPRRWHETGIGRLAGESNKCDGIAMDSLITAAARSLAHGDPLLALKRVALRDDAPALALRGIAMAQLGDLGRARELLRRATRTGYELAVAGIAIRRLDTATARAALDRASNAAQLAGIAALMAEVEVVTRLLGEPAARLVTAHGERPLLLHEVESLFASATLVADGCRNTVRCAGVTVALASRPVLFALARTLAAHWPGDASREALLLDAFRARHVDESHRARLRVEIGRLRTELAPLASIEATERGFVLRPAGNAGVAVIAPPVDERHAALLALLADGEAWSSSALALALGVSSRSIQRALYDLSRDNRVHASGKGRARRWMTPPVPGFPTALLLPASIQDR